MIGKFECTIFCLKKKSNKEVKYDLSNRNIKKTLTNLTWPD